MNHQYQLYQPRKDIQLLNSCFRPPNVINFKSNSARSPCICKCLPTSARHDWEPYFHTVHTLTKHHQQAIKKLQKNKPDQPQNLITTLLNTFSILKAISMSINKIEGRQNYHQDTISRCKFNTQTHRHPQLFHHFSTVKE